MMIEQLPRLLMHSVSNQAPLPPPAPPHAGGRQKGGYILFETVIAMVVLSVGIVVINNAIRQAVITRGIARDYTQARFLLEQIVAEAELQPQLVESTQSGIFDGDLSRFSWTRAVTRVGLPAPPPLPDQPLAQPPKLPAPYMTKITATVSWTRSGQPYSATIETLWGPEKLWLPEEPKI